VVCIEQNKTPADQRVREQHVRMSWPAAQLSLAFGDDFVVESGVSRQTVR
jgi:hypothetical protein